MYPFKDLVTNILFLFLILKVNLALEFVCVELVGTDKKIKNNERLFHLLCISFLF